MPSHCVELENDSVGLENDSVGLQNDSVGLQNDSVEPQNDSAALQNSSVEPQNDSVALQNSSVEPQNDSVEPPNRPDERPGQFWSVLVFAVPGMVPLNRGFECATGRVWPGGATKKAGGSFSKERAIVINELSKAKERTFDQIRKKLKLT